MKINLKDWKTVLTGLTTALVVWSSFKFSVSTDALVGVIAAFTGGASHPTAKP